MCFGQIVRCKISSRIQNLQFERRRKISFCAFLEKTPSDDFTVARIHKHPIYRFSQTLKTRYIWKLQENTKKTEPFPNSLGSWKLNIFETSKVSWKAAMWPIWDIAQRRTAGNYGCNLIAQHTHFILLFTMLKSCAEK